VLSTQINYHSLRSRMVGIFADVPIRNMEVNPALLLDSNIKGVQPINCRSGRIVLAFVRE